MSLSDDPQSDARPRAEVGGDALRAALQAFLVRHMPSMDHVAVLLAMREAPDVAYHLADVASRTGLDTDASARVAHDLLSTGLVRRDGSMFRYAPDESVRHTIDHLAEMYHTKPVTLVRALYDRPARAVQSFADAFRIRRTGD